MQNHRSSLEITLVCGLRGSGTTAVARALVGAHGATPVALRWDPADDPTSAPEFALQLADHLCCLADEGVVGAVVVELDPVIDAVEAALVLEAVFAARESDDPAVSLREVVAVVSADQVRRHFFGKDVPDPDDYDTGESLARQIEIATTVLISRGDRVSSAQFAEIVALVTKLNPLASFHPTSAPGALQLAARDSGSPRLPAGQGMGWMLELSGRAGHPLTVSGISTVVFRDPRPFHPGRLAEVVENCLGPESVGTILRSRGLMRLASRPQTVGGWASTGRVLTLEPTSMKSWDADSPLGQELVFVGLGLRAERLCRVLGAALLAGDELVAGPMEWANYHDTFPEWDMGHHH
jgi:G3E family GTPase